MSDVISPEEFERRMKAHSENGDTECAHVDADDLLCEVLRDLGYEKGVAIFDDMEKWYA